MTITPHAHQVHNQDAVFTQTGMLPGRRRIYNIFIPGERAADLADFVVLSCIALDIPYRPKAGE
jgi:hypothetical protein